MIPASSFQMNPDGTAWWVTGDPIASSEGWAMTIDRQCGRCYGEGVILVVDVGEEECGVCNGTGRHTFDLPTACPQGHPSTPCEEWAGVIHQEYGQAYNPKTQGTMRAHRRVWEDANGPVPDGMVLMHLCDNPPCVRLDHLRVATRAENQADMRAKGRSASGSSLPHSKLTSEQVAEIRALNEPHTATAIRYGVSASVIGRIRRNRIWVSPEPCGCERGVITLRVSVVPGMVDEQEDGTWRVQLRIH